MNTIPQYKSSALASNEHSIYARINWKSRKRRSSVERIANQYPLTYCLRISISFRPCPMDSLLIFILRLRFINLASRRHVSRVIVKKSNYSHRWTCRAEPPLKNVEHSNRPTVQSTDWAKEKPTEKSRSNRASLSGPADGSRNAAYTHACSSGAASISDPAGTVRPSVGRRPSNCKQLKCVDLPFSFLFVFLLFLFTAGKLQIVRILAVACVLPVLHT